MKFREMNVALVCLFVIRLTSYSQEYISPTKPVETGKAPGVKVKSLSTNGQTKNYVLIFAKGDEVRSGLTEFAQKYNVKTAHFNSTIKMKQRKFRELVVNKKEVLFTDTLR